MSTRPRHIARGSMLGEADYHLLVHESLPDQLLVEARLMPREAQVHAGIAQLAATPLSSDEVHRRYVVATVTPQLWDGALARIDRERRHLNLRLTPNGIPELQSVPAPGAIEWFQSRSRLAGNRVTALAAVAPFRQSFVKRAVARNRAAAVAQGILRESDFGAADLSTLDPLARDLLNYRGDDSDAFWSSFDALQKEATRVRDRRHEEYAAVLDRVDAEQGLQHVEEVGAELFEGRRHIFTIFSKALGAEGLSEPKLRQQILRFVAPLRDQLGLPVSARAGNPSLADAGFSASAARDQ